MYSIQRSEATAKCNAQKKCWFAPSTWQHLSAFSRQNMAPDWWIFLTCLNMQRPLFFFFGWHTKSMFPLLTVVENMQGPKGLQNYQFMVLFECQLNWNCISVREYTAVLCILIRLLIFEDQKRHVLTPGFGYGTDEKWETQNSTASASMQSSPKTITKQYNSYVFFIHEVENKDWSGPCHTVHCKKRLAIFPFQPGCQLPNSLWPGIDGKTAKLFFTVHG